MKYGYARVSTDDQKADLQHAALKKAGCQKVFTDDGISGATTRSWSGSSTASAEAYAI
jgi:DNA invertase Pin-like site-specific DNA recombinase